MDPLPLRLFIPFHNINKNLKRKHNLTSSCDSILMLLLFIIQWICRDLEINISSTWSQLVFLRLWSTIWLVHSAKLLKPYHFFPLDYRCFSGYNLICLDIMQNSWKLTFNTRQSTTGKNHSGDISLPIWKRLGIQTTLCPRFQFIRPVWPAVDHFPFYLVPFQEPMDFRELVFWSSRSRVVSGQ